MVVRVSWSAAKVIKPAVMPAVHIVDNNVRELAFFFKHFEDFQPEGLFQRFRIRLWSDHKAVLIIEAAVCGDNMPVGVEVKKITECLYR